MRHLLTSLMFGAVLGAGSPCLAQTVVAPPLHTLPARPRPGRTPSQLGHPVVPHRMVRRAGPHHPVAPLHAVPKIEAKRPVREAPRSPEPRRPVHRRVEAPAAPVVVPPVAPVVPAEPAKGTNTGLPLPRYASLRSDDINLRSGPGARYPIDWVYKRRELPMLIEREFDVWRLVEAPDGTKGWVHQATLTGRRTFVVTGGDATLRDGASDAGAPVAILKQGVIGRIRDCAAGAEWCELQVQDLRGWLKRSSFWGTSPGELVAPP